MFRFFCNKVGDEQAGDLVQATFLACVERRDGFRGESSVRTFLFAVARRRLYSYFESKQRADQRFDAAVSSVADFGATPSQLVERRRSYGMLLTALRTLPLEMQTLLELHYWERLTGPQLALVFDVAEGTVRTRLRRAKQLLTTAIDQLPQSRSMATGAMNLEAWANEVREEFSRSARSPR